MNVSRSERRSTTFAYVIDPPVSYPSVSATAGPNIRAHCASVNRCVSKNCDSAGLIWIGFQSQPLPNTAGSRVPWNSDIHRDFTVVACSWVMSFAFTSSPDGCAPSANHCEPNCAAASDVPICIA